MVLRSLALLVATAMLVGILVIGVGSASAGPLTVPKLSTINKASFELKPGITDELDRLTRSYEIDPRHEVMSELLAEGFASAPSIASGTARRGFADEVDVATKDFWLELRENEDFQEEGLLEDFQFTLQLGTISERKGTGPPVTGPPICSYSPKCLEVLMLMVFSPYSPECVEGVFSEVRDAGSRSKWPILGMYRSAQPC